MSDQEAAALFQAAHEEWLRGLSDTEYNQVVARTRPPDFARLTDSDRQKTILQSIAAKQAKRRPRDHNGYPLDEKGPAPQ